jgi:hypothetical protein
MHNAIVFPTLRNFILPKWKMDYKAMQQEGDSSRQLKLLAEGAAT